MKKLSNVLSFNNCCKYAVWLLILSGVFCGLIQGLWNMPFAALLAYSPLVYMLAVSSGKREFFKRAFAFFLPYYAVQLCFLVTVYNISPLNTVLSIILLVLAVICLVLWETVLMIFPLCFFWWVKSGKVWDIIAISLLISGGEWLQEHIFVLAFPWSGVWLSVTDSPLLMQSANLFGARFTSFIILALNGSLLWTLFKDDRIRSAALLSCIAIFIFGYGYYSIGYSKKLSAEEKEINAVCAQDNCEGAYKTSLSPKDAAAAYEKILEKAEISDEAGIILLPETAVPDDYSGTADTFEYLLKLSENKDLTIVTGAFLMSENNEYNAAVALRGGKALSAYCKQVLVPFGERDPFAFLTGEPTLYPCKDERLTSLLNADGMKIGCAICIESIFPAILKEQTDSGAEILCVSTNDSWFGRSFAREQHYRHSIMRAVENRRWLLRAGNCGISAIISPWGEQTNVLRENTKGTVSGKAMLIEKTSLYSRTGDIFVTMPAAVILAAIIRRFGVRTPA